MKHLADDATILRNDDCHRMLKWESLPKVSFHDLRHTFAPPDASEWGGHQDGIRDVGYFSAGFTLDTHTHVTTAAQKETAKTMEKALTAAL